MRLQVIVESIESASGLLLVMLPEATEKMESEMQSDELAMRVIFMLKSRVTCASPVTSKLMTIGAVPLLGL
jgi:hypothetical protein